MAPVSDEMRSHVEDGVRLCKEGDWNKGLPVLAAAIENRGVAEQVPGIAYSFLGYGVARFQGKLREGLQLCEHSIKLQYYEADNHFNLARVHMLSANRKLTVQALERALKLDPDHPGLLALKLEIGMRKRPVLKWLDRDHPINRWLGRLRHNWSGQPSGSPQGASVSVTSTATRRPSPSMSATGTKRPSPASSSTSSSMPRPPQR
jgi:hypothetical protein